MISLYIVSHFLYNEYIGHIEVQARFIAVLRSFPNLLYNPQISQKLCDPTKLQDGILVSPA